MRSGFEAHREEFLKQWLNIDLLRLCDQKMKEDLFKLITFLSEELSQKEAEGANAESRLENELEEKKLKQLKRDQELIEFEERGGFARILREIFNPTDDSVELDSVFQLKNLVKNYYEKKTKISKELVETLDVLLNQRPTTVSMKKKSFYREEEDDEVK